MPTSSINVRGALASDPIRNFRFLVTFMPLTVSGADQGWNPQPQIGFTSVSGLAIATESIPYREGGFNTTVHQVPGQTTFSPVTFQRGVTVGSQQHWDWMKMLFQTVSGSTFSNKQSFRSDIEIAVLAHPVPYARNTGNSNDPYGSLTQTESMAAEDDLVVARFRLYNCWPTSVAYSDLNAGDNALMVEQMTIVHEGLSMEWAKRAQDGTITAAKQF
jgi:phage tail-like protein